MSDKDRNGKTYKGEGGVPEKKHAEMALTREEESDGGMKESHGKTVIKETENKDGMDSLG